MKREILCVPCAKKLRDMFPTDEPYPGEYIKFVPGKNKGVFGIYLCDECAEDIPIDGNCFAYSVWTTRQPYFSWEAEYIKIQNEGGEG